jgi:N-acetylglucosamine-6-sulfatase
MTPPQLSTSGTRRWMPLAAALAVLVAGATAAEAPAKPSGRPNVVLVLTDDQPYESLARMPHTNGRRDWIRFDNAFINNPICCPSRATILTGLYSHHTGVESNLVARQFDDSSTIATWMSSGGYRTGFQGKYLHGYPWDRGDGYRPPGWSQWLGFLRGGYFSYAANLNGRVRRFGSRPKAYSTDVLARKARSFILRGRRPFFLMLAPTGPHPPETPAPRHAGRFDGTPVARPPSLNEADVSDKPRWVRGLSGLDPAYAAEQRRRRYRALLSVDDAVKTVFGALRKTRQLRRTIVVFMTDNGFALGEHRFFGKPCAYEECIRTPFLVRYPRQRGRRESALVTNADLAPTFAAAAGARPPAPVDGRSLLPVLRDRAGRVRDAVLIRAQADYASHRAYGFTTPAFWGVRTGEFKYVELVTGERELYDLRADPYELRNVAGQRRYADVERRLDTRLEELRSR